MSAASFSSFLAVFGAFPAPLDRRLRRRAMQRPQGRMIPARARAAAAQRSSGGGRTNGNGDAAHGHEVQPPDRHGALRLPLARAPVLLLRASGDARANTQQRRREERRGEEGKREPCLSGAFDCTPNARLLFFRTAAACTALQRLRAHHTLITAQGRGQRPGIGRPVGGGHGDRPCASHHCLRGLLVRLGAGGRRLPCSAPPVCPRGAVRPRVPPSVRQARSSSERSAVSRPAVGPVLQTDKPRQISKFERSLSPSPFVTSPPLPVSLSPSALLSLLLLFTASFSPSLVR